MQEIQSRAAVNIHESPSLRAPSVLPNQAAVCPWLLSRAKASVQNFIFSVIQPTDITGICSLGNIKQRKLLCVCILLIVYNLNFSALLFLLISEKTTYIYIWLIYMVDAYFLQERIKV